MKGDYEMGVSVGYGVFSVALILNIIVIKLPINYVIGVGLFASLFYLVLSKIIKKDAVSEKAE